MIEVYQIEKKAFLPKRWSEIVFGDILRVNKRQVKPPNVTSDISSRPPPPRLKRRKWKRVCRDFQYRWRKESQMQVSIQRILRNFKGIWAFKYNWYFNLCNSGKLVFEKPNNRIHDFKGLLYFPEGDVNQPQFVSNSQILLRVTFQVLIQGTTLKNTEWIIGVAIYTGHDCKVMQNRSILRYKSTVLEDKLNKMALFIVFIQLLACAALAYQAGVFYAKNHRNPNEDESNINAFYVFWKVERNSVDESIISFFSFFILLNTMIPISLMVSLEVVKYIQTLMIEVDVKMNDTRDPKMRVQNTLTHEQLGAIEYVFTDKTGTLTSNVMVFRNCCIDGEGHDFEEMKQLLEEQRKETKANEKSNFSSDVMSSFRLGETSSNLAHFGKKDSNLLEKDLFHDFWLCVCLCSDVIVEEVNIEENIFLYQGSSPDEVALVEAASQLSIILLSKIPGFCSISYFGEILNFEILHTIEFSSERKCMSVFVRQPNTEVVVMYSKGADSVILPHLDRQTGNISLISTKRDLKEYSKKGLRTLCLGKRVMSHLDYELWAQELNLAIIKSSSINYTPGLGISSDTKNPFKGLHEKMENGLQLIGVTAVEDKLQEDVPDVIHNLHKAGIKVWMLTGDKLETAENIGYLCSLITRETKVFRIPSGLTLDTIMLKIL